MRWKRIVIPMLVSAALAVSAVVSSVPAQAATAPVTPVPSVDLSRYVGDWYQLAAVPALYEIQCRKNVQAHYTPNADGTIAVRNTCSTWFNTTSTVNGTAKVDNAPANSALSVSFLKFGGRPIYFGGTNYVIFGLDPAYRWALVGDPSHSSGFVLSRTPSLDAATLAQIRQIVSANGYDPCAFRLTPQDGGSASRGALCRA